MITVHGPPDEVAKLVHWSDTKLEPVGEHSCRVRLRAESMEWLATTVAMVAVRFDVEVENPSELSDRVGQLSARLARATPATRRQSTSKS